MELTTVITKKQLLLLIACAYTANTGAFTLELNNGYFFGPGNAEYIDTGLIGVNRFPDAQVRDVTLFGPLTGIIPFANNGAAEPNVIAEKLATSGIVDGLTSDGTEINENADTALRLHFTDITTGEYADLAVVAERSERDDGGEPISPDEKGNLTFSPSVVADSGDPAEIVRFQVQFTTGLVEVPLSIKTQNGDIGGVDNAGPLKAGKVLVGRLGDYDSNGLLDGVLVLAANAPEDLLVARGNPIAQIRPWESDIPITPDQAAFLTLNNILQNYPQAFARGQQQGDFKSVIEHLENLDAGVEAILGNMRRLATGMPVMDAKTLALLTRVRNKLASVQKLTATTTARIDKIGLRGKKSHYRPHRSAQRVTMLIEGIMWTLKSVARDFSKLSGEQGSASL